MGGLSWQLLKESITDPARGKETVEQKPGKGRLNLVEQFWESGRMLSLFLTVHLFPLPTNFFSCPLLCFSHSAFFYEQQYLLAHPTTNALGIPVP